jgi:biopolymer transport protein TolQ
LRILRRAGSTDGIGLSGKDVPMNPADVAQSVLPLTSSDLSLFTLFWNAHWVVKTVMVGLLVCSVWVWAIAIDKTVLYTRSRRAMDRFEQAFWSGQSLDELYRTTVEPSRTLDGGIVRCSHA